LAFYANSFSDEAMSRRPQEELVSSASRAPCSQACATSSCSSLSVLLSQLAMRASSTSHARPLDSTRLLAAPIESTTVARRPSRVHRLMRCHCLFVRGCSWARRRGSPRREVWQQQPATALAGHPARLYGHTVINLWSASYLSQAHRYLSSL
jgi:hypothetical protein